MALLNIFTTINNFYLVLIQFSTPKIESKYFMEIFRKPVNWRSCSKIIIRYMVFIVIIGTAKLTVFHQCPIYLWIVPINLQLLSINTTLNYLNFNMKCFTTSKQLHLFWGTPQSKGPMSWFSEPRCTFILSRWCTITWAHTLIMHNISLCNLICH